jgi:anti-sigma factor RsiW
MTPNDFELLTAYLDQQLSPRDKAAFETRLKRDAELRQTLADLRLNRVALRNLPRLKIPRNFTLSRAQAEAIRKPRRRGLPLLFGALRLATALGALSFMILLGADAMGNVAQPAMVANAPAPQQAAEADPSLAREAVTTEGFEAFAVDGQTAPATTDDQGGETAPAEAATPDPNALATLEVAEATDSPGAEAPLVGDSANDGLESGMGGAITGTVVDNPVATVDLTAVAQQRQDLEAKQSETPEPGVGHLAGASGPADTPVAEALPVAPTEAPAAPGGALERIIQTIPLAPLTLGVGALTLVLLGLTLIVWAVQRR